MTDREAAPDMLAELTSALRRFYGPTLDEEDEGWETRHAGALLALMPVTAEKVARSDRLAAALLGVKESGPSDEPCWCPSLLDGERHSDYCIEARAALGGPRA